jgi:hypothetical protein
MTTDELFRECYIAVRQAVKLTDEMSDSHGSPLDPIKPKQAKELKRLTALAHGAAKELEQRVK